MNIHEICKMRRDSLHLTNTDIAKMSNIPLATVNKFFSAASKSPSVYTVAAVCKVLSVSMDNAFDIEPEQDDENKISRLEAEIENQTDKLNIYKKGVHHRNILIIVLLVCLVLAMLYGVIMDAVYLPSYGIFRR